MFLAYVQEKFLELKCHEAADPDVGGVSMPNSYTAKFLKGLSSFTFSI